MTGAPIENGGGEVVRRVVSIQDFMYGDYNCVRATVAKPQWRNGEDGCLGTARAASFYESSYARPHGTQETRSELRISLLILWASRLLITEHIVVKKLWLPVGTLPHRELVPPAT
jgi:hypothetical protein